MKISFCDFLVKKQVIYFRSFTFILHGLTLCNEMFNAFACEEKRIYKDTFC